MEYSDLTRRYFEAAPHAGVISADCVHRGSAGLKERGTWVQFDIHVLAGCCLEARFLAFGCPHTIAVAAWVAEQASGRTLHPGLPEPVAALAQRFEVPVEKMGRMLIVEDAWAAAVTAALAVGEAGLGLNAL